MYLHTGLLHSYQEPIAFSCTSIDLLEPEKYNQGQSHIPAPNTPSPVKTLPSNIIGSHHISGDTNQEPHQNTTGRHTGVCLLNQYFS